MLVSASDTALGTRQTDEDLDVPSKPSSRDLDVGIITSIAFSSTLSSSQLITSYAR